MMMETFASMNKMPFRMIRNVAKPEHKKPLWWRVVAPMQVIIYGRQPKRWLNLRLLR